VRADKPSRSGSWRNSRLDRHDVAVAVVAVLAGDVALVEYLKRPWRAWPARSRRRRGTRRSSPHRYGRRRPQRAEARKRCCWGICMLATPGGNGGWRACQIAGRARFPRLQKLERLATRARAVNRAFHLAEGGRSHARRLTSRGLLRRRPWRADCRDETGTWALALRRRARGIAPRQALAGGRIKFDRRRRETAQQG